MNNKSSVCIIALALIIFSGCSPTNQNNIKYPYSLTFPNMRPNMEKHLNYKDLCHCTKEKAEYVLSVKLFYGPIEKGNMINQIDLPFRRVEYWGPFSGFGFGSTYSEQGGEYTYGLRWERDTGMMYLDYAHYNNLPNKQLNIKKTEFPVYLDIEEIWKVSDNAYISISFIKHKSG